ncbi:MAG: hypothetical protein WB502_00760 [Thermoactinomyces sp.]
MNHDTMVDLAGMAFVVLIAALIVVIIVYLIKTWQTKIQSTKDEAYQKILEDLFALQEDTIRHQAVLFAEFQDMNNRIKNVEIILREVE